MKPIAYYIFTPLLILIGFVIWLILRKKSKKTILYILGVVVVIIFFIWLYNYIDNMNYYYKKTCIKFNLKVGETILFKVYEPPIDGYENYWLNNNKCSVVKLVSNKYCKNWNIMRYKGESGKRIFKFIAIKEGTDTIKIDVCPTESFQNNCNYYSEESLKVRDENWYDENYKFIITVTND